MQNKSTSYTGINYAGAQPVNLNTQTGIRYGVIPINAVMGEAIEDIYTHGIDLAYEGAKEEIKARLKSALSDYYCSSRLDQAVENAFDSLDDWAENIESDGRHSYDREGYKLQTDSSYDLWVFESPYFTYAQFCSPCAPGACYLVNPLDHESMSNRAYCLGPDWFEDGKAPYPIYSVETGKRL